MCLAQIRRSTPAKNNPLLPVDVSFTHAQRIIIIIVDIVMICVLLVLQYVFLLFCWRHVPNIRATL